MSFVAYHAQALSVPTHMGAANFILEAAQKANLILQIAAVTISNTPFF